MNISAMIQVVRLPFLAITAFLVQACAGQSVSPAAPPAIDALVSDGRDMAEAQCASCHSVGSYGESPNPQSPPLRIIFSRYRPDALEDDLINGIKVAHPMPDFQFNPQGVDALIAYLRTIQEEPAK